MIKINTHKASLISLLIIGGMFSGMPVFADSDTHASESDRQDSDSDHDGGNSDHSPRDHKKRHVKPPVPPVVSAAVDLGAVATFGLFGGAAGMTNQGIFTVVNGDIGTTGASTLITGFHDLNAVFTETPLNIGAVNGTIYTATAPLGSVPSVMASAAALAAQTAYDKLSPAALPGGLDVSSLGGGAGELGNRTLAPGIYASAPGTFSIQGGDLTLDGRGDPNAVWVFQMAATLTVGGPGAAFPQSVILVNGAQAKNVFWQVGSAATINAAGGGTMVGTILSYATTTFSTAGNVDIVTLEGRALALNASVTLVNTQVNLPAL